MGMEKEKVKTWEWNSENEKMGMENECLWYVFTTISLGTGIGTLPLETSYSYL